VTDIDSDEAGELEVELNGGSLRPIRGGEAVTSTTAEAELKVTPRLGARIEAGGALARDASGSQTPRFVGDAALGYALLHDFDHDLHVQIEVSGRLPRGADDRGEPGDSTLPGTIDLRAAHRMDRITLRANLGVEGFGHAVHAPIRAGAAVLMGFAREERFGFFGVELDADAARRSPIAIAPTIVADMTPLAIPFVFGVAIPVMPEALGDAARIGLMARLIWVSERERTSR
jgi:hypothetical protein